MSGFPRIIARFTPSPEYLGEKIIRTHKPIKVWPSKWESLFVNSICCSDDQGIIPACDILAIQLTSESWGWMTQIEWEENLQ